MRANHCASQPENETTRHRNQCLPDNHLKYVTPPSTESDPNGHFASTSPHNIIHQTVNATHTQQQSKNAKHSK